MTLFRRVWQDKRERAKLGLLVILMAVITVVVLLITFIVISSDAEMDGNGGS